MQVLGRGSRTQFPHQQGFVTFGGNGKKHQLRHPTTTAHARVRSSGTAPAQGAPALFLKKKGGSYELRGQLSGEGAGAVPGPLSGPSHSGQVSESLFPPAAPPLKSGGV